MKTVAALLAFAACASAGLAPAIYHHDHGPAIFAAPTLVKHVSPIYAVQPPIVVSKAVYGPPPVVKVLHEPAPVLKVLHHEPAPIVKVLHAPAPVVKTISYSPVVYEHAHHHHDLHHHHHGHFF